MAQMMVQMKWVKQMTLVERTLELIQTPCSALRSDDLHVYTTSLMTRSMATSGGGKDNGGVHARSRGAMS